MARRRICVVTGSRAEYGLLYWLLETLRSDERVETQIVTTGMHLSPEFGLTERQIAAEGFQVAARVEMLLSSDTAVGVTKSLGLGVIGFADALERLKPEIVVVLGDRFEILAAAQAAMLARIPIAHIHGGESTEGAVDDAIRHAITKMAQLHFVAAEPYRRRVIQLGESPQRVYDVGAPGLDYIKRAKLLARGELELALGLPPGGAYFLVTYHSATLGERDPTQCMQQLLAALDGFTSHRIVFTAPNADPGGRAMGAMVADYVERHADRTRLFDSLGQLRYLSALAYADAVIGNSSSGLIEAPALKVPTVNIGPRQAGRLRAESVVDCGEDAAAITSAVRRVLEAGFRGRLKHAASPYGQGDAASKMAHILATVPLEDLQAKRFHDLETKQ